MAHDTDTPARRLRRREALGLFGGLSLSGLLAACGASDSPTTTSAGTTATSDAAATASSCVLTPEVTEGPYWIDDALTRRDIRVGKAGLPLEAVFAVQNAKTCEPIAGADVEIWHCDAEGVYSGFEAASAGMGGDGGGPGGGGGPTDETRYLRGHQKAGENGAASFLTVFPGWYSGRTPHIHLKVHVGGDVVHTGQVFFDEQTTAEVYRQDPYASHGEPDTSHASDDIYARAGAERALLSLKARDGGGYRGTITLGVAA